MKNSVLGCAVVILASSACLVLSACHSQPPLTTETGGMARDEGTGGGGSGDGGAEGGDGSAAAGGAGGGGGGGGGAAPGTFVLSSADFVNGGHCPASSACPDRGGQDRLPVFSWTDVPATVQSFALYITDETLVQRINEDPMIADMVYHGCAYHIPASARGISASAIPEGTIFGINGQGGGASFSGPCPPDGETHSYRFQVYGIKTPGDIGTGLTCYLQPLDLITRMEVYSDISCIFP